MKICIAFLTFGKDIFAGMENSVFNLALGLKALNVEVLVYTGSFYPGKKLISGIRVFYSQYLQNSFTGKMGKEMDENIFTHYTAYKSKIESELASILAKEKPDYILAIDHLWGVLPLIDSWEEIKCPARLAFHMTHNPDLINKAVSMPFKYFFSVSNYITNELRSICPKLRQKDIHLLPNSIQLDNYNPSTVIPREDVIFCNARLSIEKGIEFLVHAFVKIVEKKPNMRLQLCGGEFHFGDSGQTKRSIKKIIAQNPEIKNRVEFLPALRWEEIPHYLHTAKVVVLPSQNESFGIAALEAMAAGTPLITTRVGNIPELVQDAGILVEYGDIDAIADTVIQVLSDSTLASTLIKRGLIIAEQYNNLLVAKNLLTILGG